MAREARLIYIQERWRATAPEKAEVVAESADGIPVGWIFLFGGRNVWEPDDKVEDRGGSSADRNRYESSMEVADARLSGTIDALRECPHLWGWMASMAIFHRRLRARGMKGFVRLDANWAFHNEQSRERINNCIAYVENAVNLIISARLPLISKTLAPLEEFCPFVPRYDAADLKRFKGAKPHRGLEGAPRAAALVVGLPPTQEDRFLALVKEECGSAFEGLERLGAPSAPAAAVKVSSPESEPQGVLARIRGLLRRSG
ncbi:hypothetical protein HZA57_04250 [Candidatus Poribacteria bacterium]|nr:hypothetical protein [Candidatus Poribacteria bacterium]